MNLRCEVQVFILRIEGDLYLSFGNYQKIKFYLTSESTFLNIFTLDCSYELFDLLKLSEQEFYISSLKHSRKFNLNMCTHLTLFCHA